MEESVFMWYLLALILYRETVRAGNNVKWGKLTIIPLPNYNTGWKNGFQVNSARNQFMLFHYKV